ncbi:MAG: CNP1-like family protein [Candidatus Accumulibacter sp.]|nr:CNP1-like family protein [Accumulibacter sp.]
MKRTCAFVLLSFFGLVVRADDFDEEFEKKPWSEIETRLPAFPEESGLIPFEVGSVAGTRYFVDGTSVSIGSDGVVRYTLVIVSSGGARNISHEGMRCATGERRYYAFGRSDKSWSKARGNQWMQIDGTSNNHHVELYSNFFCWSGSISVISPEDAVHVLKRGGVIHQ